MVSKALILNEMTKKYRVKLYSVDENDFKLNIGDNIVKFPANNDGFYLSKLDDIFREVAE